MTMSIIAISVTKILRLINLSLFSTVLMKFHHIIKTANTQNCSVTISCDWLKGSHFMTQYTGPLFSFPDTGGWVSQWETEHTGKTTQLRWTQFCTVVYVTENQSLKAQVTRTTALCCQCNERPVKMATKSQYHVSAIRNIDSLP